MGQCLGLFRVRDGNGNVALELPDRLDLLDLHVMVFGSRFWPESSLISVLQRRDKLMCHQSSCSHTYETEAGFGLGGHLGLSLAI